MGESFLRGSRKAVYNYSFDMKYMLLAKGLM